jgi:hypothetical protein
MSRWLELYATSPSGKTLFVCRMCGRVTPAPDKECPSPPTVDSSKLAMSCLLLEEIESALKDVGEVHVPLNSRMWLFKQGTKVMVTWESSPGNVKRTEVKVRERQDRADDNIPVVMLRAPDGHINNCSLANGEAEEDCQICGGNCPDRELFK